MIMPLVAFFLKAKHGIESLFVIVSKFQELVYDNLLQISSEVKVVGTCKKGLPWLPLCRRLREVDKAGFRG